MDLNQLKITKSYIKELCDKTLLDVETLEQDLRESLYEQGIEGHRIAELDADLLKEYIAEYVYDELGKELSDELQDLATDYIFYGGF